MVVSPIFITYASLTSASALGLYWSISAAFLIVQMHLAHSYYGKQAKKAAKLKDQLELNQANKTE